MVDEALTYFRANVLYRKFDVQGALPPAARLACRVTDTAGRAAVLCEQAPATGRSFT